MNSSTDSNQILLVLTGFTCNNNCIMCSLRPDGEKREDKTTEEVFEILEEGREDGYERVEFTGGEPTIRKDIFDLIAKADQLGYNKIAISTNGRLLSYEKFTRKLTEKGLDVATITLYSNEKNVHRSICATPDAFDQTVAGIKNALDSEIEVTVNTVVLKQNMNTLTSTANFLADLGVSNWGVVDLLPYGYSEERYDALSYRLEDLSQKLEEFVEQDMMDSFEVVSFFDFSLCIPPTSLLERPNTNFFAAKRKSEAIENVGYEGERFGTAEKEGEKYYTDLHKKRIDICERCKHNQDCGGVWEAYLDLYGSEEIVKLAQSHHCLKSDE